jgi:U3 small nucleolar RNA-associated protein 14
VAGLEDEKIMRQKEKKRLLAEGESGKDDMFSDDESLSNMNDVDDDLGSNRISIEEYKKRHGELAKMRALMFYEEQKRNRINKIKSKKYRKIRKRQREREKEAENEATRLDDPTFDREKMEREEMERMKERMTLAHKNTSKWARRVLRRGAKMDIEERRALSLQIAKGDELRRKMMGEDYEGGSDSEGETEEDLLKKARDILMENDDETNGEGKKKGLFQLAFMQRGQENQRKKAKEEARRLLEELEANELAAVSTDSEDEDYGVKEKPKGKPVASAAETNKVLPEGKLVASSLQFGKADSFAIKVDGNIDLEDPTGTIKKAVDDGAKNDQSTKASKNKKSRKKNKLSAADNGVSSETGKEENPWIAASNESKASKSPSLKVNINDAASMLVDDPIMGNNDGKRKRESSETTTHEESREGKSSEGIAELSQDELVRKAFATPVDLEAEEEFQKEKERMVERDDPTRQSAKEAKAVSGWGSWAGAGAPPPKKPRKLPPKLQAPTKKAENAPKRKDDGMGTVIINEKRLKKTSKFQLSEIPYPYKSREEYERALAGNLGQEWNTVQGAKEVTRPSVLVRAGKIIQPITKKAKGPKRGPAKF